MTASQVLWELARRPRHYFIDHWNWKASLFSSILRALILLSSTWSAGPDDAAFAAALEFVYRATTAGWWGAITQAFRRVEPAWQAAVAACVLIPSVSQFLDAVLHLLAGTPHLLRAVVASAVFTVVATLFNLHAMRQGSLVVGSDGRTLRHDLSRIPGLVVSFVLQPFRGSR